MAIRTTIDLPEPLHETLSSRAKAGRTSIRALIIQAVEDAYLPPRSGELITGPFVDAGKINPEFMTDENPYDVIFS